MLHLIARWLISRSIDEDRRAADWLRRWIDRDERLKRFETLSRQLGSQLKDDARVWTASRELPAGAKSPIRPRGVVSRPASVRRPRSVGWSLALSGAALAACAWFVLGHLPSAGDRSGPPGPSEKHGVAQAPAKITAADREWLATAWKTSRAHLGQWRPRAGVLPGRTESLKLPGLAPVVEAAGSTAGRGLAALDRSMASEQQQLASDAKAAFSFFTYRLPTSMARLVGWRPRAD
ncbi:MAG TPA: hypothetical protein VG125_00555 [Pirellulales bacterium]|jgi:hypothetical protein|nr:hypothetical protein [Pirellulales bacterium]